MKLSEPSKEIIRVNLYLKWPVLEFIWCCLSVAWLLFCSTEATFLWSPVVGCCAVPQRGRLCFFTDVSASPGQQFRGQHSSFPCNWERSNGVDRFRHTRLRCRQLLNVRKQRTRPRIGTGAVNRDDAFIADSNALSIAMLLKMSYPLELLRPQPFLNRLIRAGENAAAKYVNSVSDCAAAANTRQYTHVPERHQPYSGGARLQTFLSASHNAPRKKFAKTNYAREIHFPYHKFTQYNKRFAAKQSHLQADSKAAASGRVASTKQQQQWISSMKQNSFSHRQQHHKQIPLHWQRHTYQHPSEFAGANANFSVQRDNYTYAEGAGKLQARIGNNAESSRQHDAAASVARATAVDLTSDQTGKRKECDVTGFRHKLFTHTKQIATIGPSSWDYEEIERLFLSGVDIFRLNFSHGLLREKHQQLLHIRRVEQKYGHPIAVLADLPGPKLRLGSFEGDDEIMLQRGDIFTIDSIPSPGNHSRVQLPYHTQVLGALHAGDVILLDDGKLKLRVRKQLHSNVASDGEPASVGTGTLRATPAIAAVESSKALHSKVIGVECEVLVGGKLSGKKGVNVPSAAVPLSALSSRDRELARIVASWGVDWIALSFVQRAEDIQDLRQELSSQGRAFSDGSSSLTSAKLQELVQPFGGPTGVVLDALRGTLDGVVSGSKDREVGVKQLSTAAGLRNVEEHTQGEEGKPQTLGTESTPRDFAASSSFLHSFLAYSEAHVRRGERVAVLVKIEKPQALENIAEILQEADGLMVARGDLGVELAEHSAWLPVVQKRLVTLCKEAGKPVVIATQMLESMMQAPTPTRAELSDVATAVYDGADAVMLSGETAAGAAPSLVAKTQYRGISAVESDPSFWVIQDAQRAQQLKRHAALSARRMILRSLAESCRTLQDHSSTTIASAAQTEALELPGQGTNTFSTTGVPRHDNVCEAQTRKQPEQSLNNALHVNQCGQSKHRIKAQTLFPELMLKGLPWARPAKSGGCGSLPLLRSGEEIFPEAGRRAATLAAAASSSFVSHASDFDNGMSQENSVKKSIDSSLQSATQSKGQSSTHTQEEIRVADSARRNSYRDASESCYSIAVAAEQAARHLGANWIVAVDDTGRIARRLSSLRPTVPIVAITRCNYTARELQLHWGIYPVFENGTGHMVTDDSAVAQSKSHRDGKNSTSTSQEQSLTTQTTKALELLKREGLNINDGADKAVVVYAKSVGESRGSHSTEEPVILNYMALCRLPCSEAARQRSSD